MNAFAQCFDACRSASPKWLDVWQCIEDSAMRSICAVAATSAIAPLDLKLRVLLHLPRFDSTHIYNQGLVHEEICRLAKNTVQLQREFSDWSSAEPVSSLDKAVAHVLETSEAMATIIHERFHYLASNRSGRHFALYFDNKPLPAALATFSEMDVQKLRPYVPAPDVTKSRLLSRVFAFRWAPRNSISYLLGAAIRRIHSEESVENFLTWVNPNLGFTASSYRSANWDMCGSEPVTYHYLAANYLSARQLFNDRGIKHPQVQFSRWDLDPLQVWKYSVKQ